MAQRNNATPPKQQELFSNSPDARYFQPRSESNSPPGSTERKGLQYHAFSFKMSGGEPDGDPTHIGTYPSYTPGWKAAEALAEAKKEELEEQAKLAGNPTPNVMVLSDVVQGTHTVSVDGAFRWRCHVEAVKADLEKSRESNQPSGSSKVSSGPLQQKRQDTPAQASPYEGFMQLKQELGGSMSASLAGISTSAPEGHGELSTAASSTVDRIITDEVPIDIPPEPTTSDFEGDTVADEESSFNQMMEEVMSDSNSLFNGTTKEVMSDKDRLFNESIGAVVDTNSALPEVTSKPAATQHLEPSTEANLDTNAALEDSHDAQQTIDQAQTSSQKAQSDLADRNNTDIEAEAPTATKLQMEYGPAHFGLYLTLTYPPAPAVTYRIQLNTSLGQAQSDMKLIAANEMVKAQAQGVADDMKLEMNVNKIDIVHKNGSRLSYEIAEGAFIDEIFSSEMEQAGRVVDGESYTRVMFEKATVESEKAHRETLQSEMPTTEEDKESEAETEAAGNVEEKATSPPATSLVEEPLATPRETSFVEGPLASPAPSDAEDPVLSPLANVSRKRQQSPIEALPTDAPTQDVSTSQETPIAPSPKKRKVDSASPRAGRPESHDKSPSQQNPTPIALHAPIKKRGRAPEELTSYRSASEAAAEPVSKKARLSPAADAETELDEEDEKESVAADDPNALYCRCRQPDDGSHMFACDGETCPNNGWAHMACFPEMKVEPEDDDGKSKWYCPDCDPAAFETAEEEEEKPKKKKKTAGKKGGATSKKETAGRKGVAVKKGAAAAAGKKETAGKKGGSAANRRKLIR